MNTIVVQITSAALIVLGMFLGGALGSALFCLVERKKAGIPWADNSRSHCDSCGRTLTFIDLIPVISYLILKGKCRTCKAKIPINGFRVEVVFALAVGLVTCTGIKFYDHHFLIICVSILAIICAGMVLYIETRPNK